MTDHDHPQTSAFHLLFPRPELNASQNCGLETQFKELWDENFKDTPWTFINLSAKPPGFDHQQAESGGNDYSCSLYAYFTRVDGKSEEFSIFLGHIPYPDKNGEFVLGGNRYYVPMFLCTPRQHEKLRKLLSREKDDDSSQREHDRATSSVYIVLLDELLEQRLWRQLDSTLKKLKERIYYDDPPSSHDNSFEKELPLLRTFMKRWLMRGDRSFLHNIIYKHGDLVNKANPLARISQHKELSFYAPGIIHPESTGELHLRDVSDDDLYKICPVQSPQGHKVGLRIYLARQSEIDLNQRKIIAPDQPQSGDSLSDAAALIPFIEHDDVSRALMGANMMKQAMPLKEPEAPLIQTGWEKELGQKPEIPEDFKSDGVLALGKNLLTAYLPWGLDTFEDGIVISESAAQALTAKLEKVFWFEQENQWLDGYFRPLFITAINPRIPKKATAHLDDSGIVRRERDVKPGDVLVSAMIIRSKKVNKTKFIDTLIAKKTVSDLLKQSPEEVRDVSLRLPYNFKGRVTEIIDSKDTPSMKLPFRVSRRIGIKVERHEPVKVGDKIASRHGAKGVVIQIFPDSEMPYLKTEKQYCTSDKCPVTEPHRHIQIIQNPLGVTGRLNPGQLFETALAKIAERQNEAFIVRPFDNKWDLISLGKDLESHGFSQDGKEQLYVFEKKAELPLRHLTFVGPQYFLRLHHLAEEKSQGRGKGEAYDYTIRDNQPRVGKRLRGKEIIGSGQRVGEMETWALAGHAAWHLLDDLLTFKSDDERLRKIDSGEESDLDVFRFPQALANLILVFRSLGIDLKLLNGDEDNVTQKFLEKREEVEFDQVAISVASPDQMKDWGSGGEIRSLKLYTKNKDSGVKGDESLDQEGLFSPKIFDPGKPWQMGHINLVQPVIHPMARLIKRKDHNPRDYIIDCLPVLPPRFRYERLGFYKNLRNDLNILYRNVIQKNDKLRKVLEDKESENGLCESLKKGLNKAVRLLFFRLFPYEKRGLIDTLKGKKGLIRGHLAGKRVDYSGRAVIVGDPDLALDEAALPESLWNKLFGVLDKSARPVMLLNRQPSLHRYSVQAFYVLCHNRGNVICMNPYVCRPFNADYDGDTITVHIPRKSEAKEEAKKLLPSRNLLSQANGKMVLGFEKDIALAAAYVSYHPDIDSDEEIPFTSEQELGLEGKDLWERISLEGVETTVGRLQLRRFFGVVPIFNRCMDKKDWNIALEGLMKEAVRKGPEVVDKFTKRVSQLFGQALKRSGLSLSLQDFQVPIDPKIKDETPPFLWLLRAIGKYEKELKGHLTQKRGKMRCPGSDKSTRPIKSSLLKGHTEKEYLLSAHGARAGLVDKGLITALSGELLRKWIYSLQHIYIVEEDCRTSEGLEASFVDEEQLVSNRFDIKGTLIEGVKKGLYFRSPLTCQAHDDKGHAGICQKCYGHDPATGELPEIGLPVGILAAQALGERITQETLKSFHTGGRKEEKKKGRELIKYLEKAFSEGVKDDGSAARKIHEIFKQFSSGGRPSLVHFEVVLRGLKEKELKRVLFKKLAYSQAPKNLFDMAIKKDADDLYGVISRIVSGHLIAMGPIGGGDE